MQLLLITSFIVTFVYIGYIMSKLDKFLGDKGFLTEEADIRPIAIVLGQKEVAKQICELLEKNNISVYTLNEPFLIEKDLNFRYLFALSENDADNIVLCKIGKKVYSIKKIISICNEKINEGMFVSEGIRYLSSVDVNAFKLFNTLYIEKEVKL